MKYVIALGAVVLVALMLFLLWFMLKGLGVDFQWMKADSQRLVRGRRKLYWAAAAAVPVCIGSGAAIGAIVAHGSNLGASVKGDAIGGAVGFVLTVVFAVLAGPVRKSDGATATKPGPV